jgi:hypothetical protein
LHPLESAALSRRTPVAEISKIEYLNMEQLPVEDLTPLSNLVYLKNLKISNITPLSQLSNLEVLDISWTQVESLEPIIELPNLRHLIVFDAPLPEDQLRRFLDCAPGRKIENWGAEDDKRIRPPMTQVAE